MISAYLYDVKHKNKFYCSYLFIAVHRVTSKCVVNGVVSPVVNGDYELRFFYGWWEEQIKRFIVA